MEPFQRFAGKPLPRLMFHKGKEQAPTAKPEHFAAQIQLDKFYFCLGSQHMPKWSSQEQAEAQHLA